MNASEDRRPLKSRSLGWVRALAGLLVKWRVTPNTISATGVVFAILGAAVLCFGWRAGIPAWVCFVVAVGLVQARLMCNLLDGLVAVEGGLKSKGGDLFNEIPDRIEDPLFLAAAGYACGNTTAGWLCAVLAVFTAYLRAFGASLGQGQDFGGPCAKPQRMFLLTVGMLAQAVVLLANQAWNVLEWFLWIIAAGTAVTSVLRIGRMYRKAP